jgi:hypothetical protein
LTRPAPSGMNGYMPRRSPARPTTPSRRGYEGRGSTPELAEPCRAVKTWYGLSYYDAVTQPHRASQVCLAPTGGTFLRHRLSSIVADQLLYKGARI